MSELVKPGGRDVKPEGEEAYRLAESWLSEPAIIATGLCIFVACVVLLEAPALYDAIVALFPK
jgi:hypothetical protein